MTADKVTATRIPAQLACQQFTSTADGATAVTDAQMYTAFSAENLASAIRCLSQAIREQPVALAYLRPMLEQWRNDLSVLEADAGTKVCQP